MDVCLGANYFKTGEDPAIRPESEYPDWLWGLEPDKQLQVAPDSKQYWRRTRKKQAHSTIAALREKQ
jgi:large subunit ribosomal protein L54